MAPLRPTFSRFYTQMFPVSIYNKPKKKKNPFVLLQVPKQLYKIFEMLFYAVVMLYTLYAITGWATHLCEEGDL